MMKLKILKASFHRNGVGGAGFYAIIFKDVGEKKTMVASLFDENCYCAVYDIEQLQKHNIEFGNGNSWRGDHYETELRPLLEKFLKKGSNRLGPFAFPQKVEEDDTKTKTQH